MRIAQTSDGRFIKVLSPEMQGLIGRMYQEIRERKGSDLKQNEQLVTHANALSLTASKIDMLLVRYAELSSALRELFPEDEDVAVIDKPLVVSQTVTALQYISETVTSAPLVVHSSIMVNNLNAQFVGGKSVDQLAPIEHVGAGGVHAHPNATQTLSGFMSTSDKTKVDGITVNTVAPTTPQVGHIWFDLNN